jgi:hypothetical protein
MGRFFASVAEKSFVQTTAQQQNTVPTHANININLTLGLMLGSQGKKSHRPDG